MDRRKYEYSSMKKEDSIRNQIIVVACINLGQIIVGYSTGWSAPISSKLRDPDSSPLPEPVTELQLSWIGSLLLVGSLMGPYLTGPLSNTVGRKPCIILGGILNILTYFLVVMTRNIATIYALRVISGLGMGITTVCNIVYVGEIASTHIRGILLTSTGIMGICGTLLVYAVGPYVSYAATGYIALAISIAQVVAVAMIPESPVFYAMKGKEKQLINSLNRLGRPSDYKLIKESYSTTEKSSNLKDWTEIFTVKSNRVSFFITFCLVGLQQLNGAMAVLLFATTIFEIAGSSIEPDVATIVIGATRLVPSVLAPALIERTGRKLLLMISQCACAVSLTILGIYFYLDRIQISALDKIGWLPLVALVMFFFSYESGFGPIPNTIVGEMYRANVRANGSTLSMTLAWALGFALTTSFSSMVNTLGGDVTFWIFSGACVVAFLFTYLFVPETRGKTLDEIQEMMS